MEYSIEVSYECSESEKFYTHNGEEYIFIKKLTKVISGVPNSLLFYENKENGKKLMIGN